MVTATERKLLGEYASIIWASDEWFKFPRLYLKLMTPEDAIILQTIIDGSEGKLDDEGWFICTMEFLERETGLSDYDQRKILSKLQDANWLEFEPRGLPAKRCVRMIWSNLVRDVVRVSK